MRKLYAVFCVAAVLAVGCAEFEAIGNDTFEPVDKEVEREPVPDVVGQDFGWATLNLEFRGYKVEAIDAHGDRTVSGHRDWVVLSQEPAPGTTDVETVKIYMEKFSDRQPTTTLPATTTTESTAPPPKVVETPTRPAEGGGHGVYYPNCAAARAAGVDPIYEGEPGYRSGLDRDGDGIACE